MVFLILFFVLLFSGKIQAWLIILITGFCSSLIIGRVYCGWCCPVNAMNDLIEFLYKQLGIKKKSIPESFKHSHSGLICFVLFLGLFTLSLMNGNRPHLFTIITFSGVLVSGIFISSLWCNYLCPWGTLLKITSNYSVFTWSIDMDKCIGCGVCASNCPSNTIQKSDNVIQSIEYSLCLQCLRCINRCPKYAIKLERRDSPRTSVCSSGRI